MDHIIYSCNLQEQERDRLKAVITRIQPGIIINVHRYSCKAPVIVVKNLMKFEFLDIFSKNTQTSNFVKIRPVEPRCSIRSSVTKLIVTFRNFSNAPKNYAEVDACTDGEVQVRMEGGELLQGEY